MSEDFQTVSEASFSEVAPALLTLHTERVDRHGGAEESRHSRKGQPMAREGKGAISFDDLARGLADGTITRGKALRLMGAALVGGALGSVGIGEAAADPPGCKRNGKACKKDTQCCSGNCVNSTCAACPSETTPCGTECCQTGATCVNGTCCPNAQVCGTGTSLTCCPSGQECADGVCRQPCIPASTPTTTCSQCCSGTCQPGGSIMVCCTGLGGSCTFPGECCGSTTCDTTDGTCCSMEECTTDSDCCSSRALCIEGTCLPL